MGPPRTPPTLAEAMEIRRTAELAALSGLPGNRPSLKILMRLPS